jgi:hypothetical protein
MEIEREMSRYEVTPFGIFLETWDGSGGIKRECLIPRDCFVEAYEKWIKNAPTEKINKMEEEKTYGHGANDAWELAKRLFISSDFGGFTGDEVLDIFGTMDPCEVATSHSGIGVLEHYREYKEKKKNEINVGDEVRCKELDNPKLIVTHIYRDEGKFDALGYDGSASVDMTLALWEKTG